MYSNIPISEKKQILENMLTANSTDHRMKSEIINWYDVITKKIYFSFYDKTIVQTDGFAMGAPSSSIISEIFLQHIAHTHTFPTCPANTNL
jgi:hypothetical protein